MKLALKAHSFYTDSLTYSQREGAFITIEVTASMATGSSKTGMPCLARTTATCVTAAPTSTQEWLSSFLKTRDVIDLERCPPALFVAKDATAPIRS
jgi:hypothetical protein